ncbi:MAG: hypothetical protein IPJ71_04985 [Bdellovibrionales bacterium]|nr:hypothetical protein [Bdellovibrionales bacterium]
MSRWNKDPGKFYIGGLTVLIFLIIRIEASAMPQSNSASLLLQGPGSCLPWLNRQNLVPFDEKRNHGQIHADLFEITEVLLTDKIDESQFPYASQQRPPISLNPQTLFGSLSALPEINELTITSILIATPKKEAGQGLVRLGFLQNRRPVVVKTLITTTEEAARMNEAKGAMLLSAIGVGPLFHGIAREGTRFHLITDLIIGSNFIPFTSPSIQTLRQLATIMNRFRTIHLDHLPEHEILFQVMRTNSDQVLVIDAEGYYEEFLAGNSNIEEQKSEDFLNIIDLEPRWNGFQKKIRTRKISWAMPWSDVFASVIITADLETTMAFMNEFRDYNRPLYKSVVLEIKSIIHKWEPRISNRAKEFLLSLDGN